MTKHSLQTSILEWVFIVAISIVAVMLAAYSFSEFYPAPKYETFCKDIKQIGPNETEDSCIKADGKWTDYGDRSTTSMTQVAPPAAVSKDITVATTVFPAPTGYCDLYFTCNQNFQDAQNDYKSTLFIILTILGLVLLSASIYVKRYFILSIAFSLVGIISIFAGGVINWSNLNSRFKVVLLGIVLVALVVLAIKKFESKHDTK